MTIKLSPLNHRWQLGELCKYELAVEVGTHRGQFAEQLARARDGGKLWCIDPWTSYPGAELLTGGGVDREADLNIAYSTLKQHIRDGRVELFRGTSADATLRFKDSSTDLVYIDGDHSYDAVWHDLQAWWPKVKPGGLLAGHDFICPGDVDVWPGVQKAVLAFADRHALDIWLVPENAVETAGQPWSFYMEKPK